MQYLQACRLKGLCTIKMSHILYGFVRYGSYTQLRALRCWRRIPFTLHGLTSSVAELNCGSVTSHFCRRSRHITVLLQVICIATVGNTHWHALTERNCV